MILATVGWFQGIGHGGRVCRGKLFTAWWPEAESKGKEAGETG